MRTPVRRNRDLLWFFVGMVLTIIVVERIQVTRYVSALTKQDSAVSDDYAESDLLESALHQKNPRDALSMDASARMTPEKSGYHVHPVFMFNTRFRGGCVTPNWRMGFRCDLSLK